MLKIICRVPFRQPAQLVRARLPRKVEEELRFPPNPLFIKRGLQQVTCILSVLMSPGDLPRPARLRTFTVTSSTIHRATQPLCSFSLGAFGLSHWHDTAHCGLSRQGLRGFAPRKQLLRAWKNFFGGKACQKTFTLHFANAPFASMPES